MCRVPISIASVVALLLTVQTRGGSAMLDLDQWGAVLAEPEARKHDVWQVRDGVLICRGEPMGYLHTKQTYTNVSVRFEWRWRRADRPATAECC